jgi:hypothetical protein
MVCRDREQRKFVVAGNGARAGWMHLGTEFHYLNIKTAIQLEAVEPHTIAIVAIIFSGDMFR